MKFDPNTNPQHALKITFRVGSLATLALDIETNHRYAEDNMRQHGAVLKLTVSEHKRLARELRDQAAQIIAIADEMDATFTESAVSVTARPSLRDRFNEVMVQYVEPDLGYEIADDTPPRAIEGDMDGTEISGWGEQDE